MEWLESDFKKFNQQNRSLFLNKIKSNASSNNFNCYLFNESGNPNQDLFFITDLKIRLKAKINPKRMFMIRKLYEKQNNGVLLINIFIKQFLYSTMINFRNSKEPFIFMIINDFDLRSDQNKYTTLSEIQYLIRWDHLKNANMQLPSFNYILPTRNEVERNNLSLLIENLSQPKSANNSDYTIEIVQENSSQKPKNPANLNEAFANGTLAESTSVSSSTQTIEPSFVENFGPKSSSQIVNVQCQLNSSVIPVTNSSITISKIQELTDDEDENISKTYQFSPKLCDSHSHCIKETQNETKKRRTLLNTKYAGELNENSESSLISNEYESKPAVRITRTSSSSSSASTSSSSVSSFICNTPKAYIQRPKTDFFSEPRNFNLKNKIKDSHLIFSPVKNRTERKQKLKEIKKKYLSNPQFKLIKSPAKTNSDLVDKILNIKNVISSDEEEYDMGKLSFGRRRLLFDKNNQLKQLDKAFDSVDKSIPSGQNQCINQNNSMNQSFGSIQSNLLNYRFISDHTDDKLQEYLVHLAEMTKSMNSK